MNRWNIKPTYKADINLTANLPSSSIMSINILFLIFLFYSYCIMGQTRDFVSNRALENTFLIHTDTLAGTCFAFFVHNEEYLITARHLFKKSLKNQDSTEIKIFKEEKFHDFNAKYFVSTDTTVDIAVLKIDKTLSKFPPYSRTEKTILGQQLYFLGYPSFNNIQFKTLDKKLGTFPLIKKAIFSGGYPINNYQLFFLDGNNNPGFSGGPVIAYDFEKKENGIFGIISGYYHEEKKLLNQGVEELGKYIMENSGIIKCFPINLVEEIINQQGDILR